MEDLIRYGSCPTCLIRLSVLTDLLLHPTTSHTHSHRTSPTAEVTPPFRRLRAAGSSHSYSSDTSRHWNLCFSWEGSFGAMVLAPSSLCIELGRHPQCYNRETARATEHLLFPADPSSYRWKGRTQLGKADGLAEQTDMSSSSLPAG